MKFRRSVQLAAAFLWAGSIAAAADAADCTPPVAARLAAAGRAQRDALCAVAAAVSNRGIFLQVRGELLDQLARSTFPLSVATSGSSAVTFTSGRYCGATGAHSADLIAVSLQAKDGTPIVASTPDTSECRASLESVALRLSVNDATALVARVRIAWTPWNLTMSLLDAASTGVNAQQWAEQRVRLLARPLHVRPMRGISVPLTTGNVRSLQLSSIVWFFDDAVAIGLAPEMEFASMQSLTDVPAAAAIMGSRLANAPGNGSILLAHGGVNAFARELLAVAPFPVGTNLPLLDNVDVREFSVRGGRDAYDLIGVLVDGDDETYPGRINLRGADLSLADMSIDADVGHCDSVDFSCQLLRAARQALAREVTNAARKRLQERQGRAWLDYIERRTFPIPWVGTTIGLSGTVERTSSDDEALILHARFSLARVND